MINNVIKAVCKAINEKLNSTDKKFEIYTEAVEQGLKVPCFFVYCNNYSDELYRGKRYKVSADIIIEFVQSDKQINSSTNEVLETLYDITERIELEGNTVMGLSRKVENSESGVVFSVKFEFFYYKTEEVENMEDLGQKEVVNNDN